MKFVAFLAGAVAAAVVPSALSSSGDHYYNDYHSGGTDVMPGDTMMRQHEGYGLRAMMGADDDDDDDTYALSDDIIASSSGSFVQWSAPASAGVMDASDMGGMMGSQQQPRGAAQDAAAMRALKKNKNQNNIMVPQPMEFHNFPVAQPSVGGYRPPSYYQQPHAGSVGVAPFTSVIETDDRLRLTSVMSADNVILPPAGGQATAMRQLNRMPDPQGGMEHHQGRVDSSGYSAGNSREAPSSGGVMHMLNGHEAQVVDVRPWASMVEVPDYSLPNANALHSAGHRAMHEEGSIGGPIMRDVPYFKWSPISDSQAEL